MSTGVSTSTDKIIVDRSRSHRNKAVSRAVRATRERLQTVTGVSAGLEARAARHVRIAQPGGEESLNVAAAAAICLYASAAAADS